MNTFKRIALLILVFGSSFVLLACQPDEEGPEGFVGYNDGLEDIIDTTMYSATVANEFTDDDEDVVDHESNNFLEQNTAMVFLADENTIITNDVEDTLIYMEQGDLIVESTKKLTLIVTGTLNGSIDIFKTDGKLQLILDGVDITSDSGPAINLQTAKRTFVVLAEGSTNQLTDGPVHPTMTGGYKTKGTLFSESQIIISGEGELNVTGRYKHGIVSDDYLKVLSGTIRVLSAESDGFHANDYIAIDGGTIDINANSDGIECEKGFVAINGGTITIRAGKDGIKTSHQEPGLLINPYVHINNGVLDITVLKEGIKSTASIILKQGAVIINSLDDAVSAVGEVRILDGIYLLHSVDKQTLDGDLGVTIEGGMLVLLADGDTDAIESDASQIELNGGTIVIAGPDNMDLSASQQGYLICDSVAAETTLDIRSTSSLLTVVFLLPYDYVVVSTPDFSVGSALDLYSGGVADGDNFYGLYINGTYTDGEYVDTIIVE